MKELGNRIRRARQILGRGDIAVALEEHAKIKLGGQIAISILLILAGVYFIVWSGDESLADAALGWIGIVVGYWIG